MLTSGWSRWLREAEPGTERPPFSLVLEAWLHGRQPKTAGALINLTAQKGVAMVVGVLTVAAMAALTLPVGGIEHIFEIIVILLAVELVVGRQTLWLPQRWLGLLLEDWVSAKGTQWLVAVARWLERFLRPRLADWLSRPTIVKVIGTEMLGFVVAALLAPSFSGLGILPLMGVVMLALALVFEDALLLVLGTVIGITGIALVLELGALINPLF